MPGEFVLARVILNGFGYVDPLFWLIWTTHKKLFAAATALVV
jgi:hypothetical protein